MTLRWVVLVALLTALAHGKLLCLQGEAPLAVAPGAPDRAWCTADDCTLRWSLTLDTTTVDDQRWALQATVNGTALSQLIPQLTDVRVQCSTSGEVIATTSSGPNSERLRLIWTYSGVSSVSCAYVLSAADLQADFRNFQALLAYSGHISSFDATFSSQAPDYSIASVEQPCPQADTSSSSTSGHPHSQPESCQIGDCRHAVTKWHALPDDPTWHAVQMERFCSLSCSDIIMDKGQAKAMPVHWREEAQQLCAAKLNAAMYGCSLPLDTNEALQNSNEYLSNPLKCSLNADRTIIVTEVAAWNSHDTQCVLDGNDNAGTDTGVTKNSTSKADAYLIWAIVMTVAFALLCVVALGVLLAFAGPIRAYMAGSARALTNSIASERVGGEMEMVPVASEQSFLSSFFSSGDYEEDTGEVPRPSMRAYHAQPRQGPQPLMSLMAAAQMKPSAPTRSEEHLTAAYYASPAPTYASNYATPAHFSYTSAPGQCAPAPERKFSLSSYASGDPTGPM